MFHEKNDISLAKSVVNFKQNGTLSSSVTVNKPLQFFSESEIVPFPPIDNYNFKFIDLFAGIGGFRLALQNHGGKCVYTSEWDIDAQKHIM